MTNFGMPAGTIWNMRSPEGRVITCEMRETNTGLELRLAYGDELVWSQEFFGPAARLDIEMRAVAWRIALFEKGFTLDVESTTD